jgi:hypothetical protein
MRAPNMLATICKLTKKVFCCCFFGDIRKIEDGRATMHLKTDKKRKKLSYGVITGWWLLPPMQTQMHCGLQKQLDWVKVNRFVDAPFTRWRIQWFVESKLRAGKYFLRQVRMCYLLHNHHHGYIIWSTGPLVGRKIVSLALLCLPPHHTTTSTIAGEGRKISTLSWCPKHWGELPNGERRKRKTATCLNIRDDFDEWARRKGTTTTICYESKSDSISWRWQRWIW